MPHAPLSFWKTLPKPILMLSPMAGVTDSAFRQLAKTFGADVVFTEFISSDGLHYGRGRNERLEFDESERPVVCQIFGSKPEFFFEAARRIEEEGFDGVDINFGCPAKKVVKSGGGITMLRDLDRCYEIVQATCEAVKAIPVSVKTRKSVGCVGKNGEKLQTRHTVLELIEKIKNLPVEALILHGRTFETPFVGDPDFDIIREAKQRFNGVVLANGGITNPEKAKEMLERTGADGIALARGAIGRPWLFRQIRDYLSMNAYVEPSFDAIQKIALDHAQKLIALKGEGKGIQEMRKHLLWYVRGNRRARELRRELATVTSLFDIEKIFSCEQSDYPLLLAKK